MTRHKPRAVPWGAEEFVKALLNQFGFHTYVPPDGRAIEMVRKRDAMMRAQGVRLSKRPKKTTLPWPVKVTRDELKVEVD